MTDATDKHGQPVKVGDTVEIVHFGEFHPLTVEKLEEINGITHVHGKVTAKVPLRSTKKVTDHQPSTEPDPAEGEQTAPRETPPHPHTAKTLAHSSTTRKKS